jgi:hypothetical protein
MRIIEYTASVGDERWVYLRALVEQDDNDRRVEQTSIVRPGHSFMGRPYEWWCEMIWKNGNTPFVRFEPDGSLHFESPKDRWDRCHGGL